MLAAAAFLMLMPGGDVWSQEGRLEGKEYQITVPLEVEYYDDSCAANLGLEYYQKNTHAHVKATLKNTQCGASSGSYTVRILYRPDEGEQGEVQYEETWSRDDDADIVMEKEYYVGENLEVRRVRSSKLTCQCTQVAEDASTEAAPADESNQNEDRE